MMYIKVNNELVEMNYEDIWNWHTSNCCDDFDEYERLLHKIMLYIECVYPEQIERLMDYEDLDNHFPFLTEEDYKELCDVEENKGFLEWLDSRFDQEAYLFENQLTLF